MKKSEKIMAAILGVDFTPKYKRLAVTRRIAVKDESLAMDVPVLVEMLHPNGGKIMIPSEKINSLLALGLAIRRRYE